MCSDLRGSKSARLRCGPRIERMFAWPVFPLYLPHLLISYLLLLLTCYAGSGVSVMVEVGRGFVCADNSDNTGLHLIHDNFRISDSVVPCVSVRHGDYATFATTPLCTHLAIELAEL